MSTAAQQLSQWLEDTHPDFFRVLYGHVARQQSAAQLRRARLRGFGDDSSDLYFTPDLPSTGGSSDLYFTPDLPSSFSVPAGVDPSTSDYITSQYTPGTVDIPTLTESDLTSATLQPSGTSAVDSPTDNSGSFLTSLGAGISNAAASVGNFLASPQGLNDVTKLASAYFQLQNNKVNAQVQTAVLQAQVARTANGASPASLSYAAAPNGQLVPVYVPDGSGRLPASLAAAVQNGTSQYVTTPSGVSGYTVPSNMVSSFGSNMSLSGVLPWVAAIVGGLLLAKGLSR